MTELTPQESQLQNQLFELESRLAFQDDALLQLNNELLEHQRRIDKLQRQILLLAEKLQGGPQGDSGILRSHEEPPPPHY